MSCFVFGFVSDFNLYPLVENPFFPIFSLVVISITPFFPSSPYLFVASLSFKTVICSIELGSIF